MGFDPVSLVTKVIDWILHKRAENKAQVSAYIDEIRTACRDLTKLENPNSDEGVYLHEQIKQMYARAMLLPHSYLEGGAGVLFRALSSARIYYWLKVVGAEQPEKLRELFQDRNDRSDSFERVADIIQGIYRSSGSPSAIPAATLAELRRECLRDVERLLQIKPV